MSKQMSDKTLAAYVDSLPKEMSPQRDLWSGIERAIHDKSQQSGNVNQKNSVAPVAWAASFIAAVLLSWVAFSPTSRVTAPVTASNENELQPPHGQLVSSMQASFQQQKQAMLVSYGQPDMTHLPANMQAQLEELAKARNTIKKALINDENNIDLLNLLRFMQQQELNLLQQLYPYMNNNNIQWQTI